ncbi:hypothetical protein FM107_06450 [Sphingobacterium sp. JB170]|nr:hypothetical protein FM107_06450 [Sphingobacterium sp. JB170]
MRLKYYDRNIRDKWADYLTHTLHHSKEELTMLAYKMTFY